MNGPTYMLTELAVKAILNKTSKTNAIPIEDILYTGIIANIIKADKINRWNYFRFNKVSY